MAELPPVLKMNGPHDVLFQGSPPEGCCGFQLPCAGSASTVYTITNFALTIDSKNKQCCAETEDKVMIPSGRFISVSSKKVGPTLWLHISRDDAYYPLIFLLVQAKSLCFSTSLVFVFYKPTASTFITPFATLTLSPHDTDRAMQAIQDSMYFHNPTTTTNL